MNFIDLTLVTIDEARFKDYGKDNVIRLLMSTVEPMALAAPSYDVMKKWLDIMEDNVNYARSQQKLMPKGHK